MIWLAVTVLLGVLALRGSRAAYFAYLAFALAFLPVRASFHLQPLSCELSVSLSSAAYSLQNWKHVLLCALVAGMTLAQLPARRALGAVVAVAATLALGLAAEIEQGAFGQGHCRLRDLAPDALGALLGVALWVAWRRLRRGRATATEVRG